MQHVRLLPILSTGALASALTRAARTGNLGQYQSCMLSESYLGEVGGALLPGAHEALLDQVRRELPKLRMVEEAAAVDVVVLERADDGFYVHLVRETVQPKGGNQLDRAIIQ